MNTKFINHLRASETEVREWPSWKSLSLDSQPSTHQSQAAYKSTYVTISQRIETTKIDGVPPLITSKSDK